jgi:hypothetical protein
MIIFVGGAADAIGPMADAGSAPTSLDLRINSRTLSSAGPGGRWRGRIANRKSKRAPHLYADILS